MLNVAELRKKLKDLPGHMPVYIFDDAGEFPCHPIGSVEVEKVQHREDPSGPSLATETVLLLKPE